MFCNRIAAAVSYITLCCGLLQISGISSKTGALQQPLLGSSTACASYSSKTVSTAPLDASTPVSAAPPTANSAATVAANRKAKRLVLWQRMRRAGAVAQEEGFSDPDRTKSLWQLRQEARTAVRQAGHASLKPPATTSVKHRVIEGICRRENIKLGWKKIDFVLRMIRRSYVDDAMAQLSANPKKAAVYVMHAIANARNNAICAGGDPAKLWVSEAYVTKGKYQKRVAIMGRGYSGIKETRHSHLNVKVRQLDDADPAAAKMLRRSARLIAPLMVRQQQFRGDQNRPRLKLWSGRGLQQQIRQ